MAQRLPVSHLDGSLIHSTWGRGMSEKPCEWATAIGVADAFNRKLAISVPDSEPDDEIGPWGRSLNYRKQIGYHEVGHINSWWRSGRYISPGDIRERPYHLSPTGFLPQFYSCFGRFSVARIFWTASTSDSANKSADPFDTSPEFSTLAVLHRAFLPA